MKPKDIALTLALIGSLAIPSIVEAGLVRGKIFRSFNGQTSDSTDVQVFINNGSTGTLHSKIPDGGIPGKWRVDFSGLLPTDTGHMSASLTIESKLYTAHMKKGPLGNPAILPTTFLEDTAKHVKLLSTGAWKVKDQSNVPKVLQAKGWLKRNPNQLIQFINYALGPESTRVDTVDIYPQLYFNLQKQNSLWAQGDSFLIHLFKTGNDSTWSKDTIMAIDTLKYGGASMLDSIIFANPTLSVFRDVGVDSLLLDSVYNYGAIITPQAKVRNLGTINQKDSLIFRIGNLYYASDTATISPGIHTLNFRPCTLNTEGTLLAVCKSILQGDTNTSNDSAYKNIRVRAQEIKDVGVTAIENPIGIIDSSGLVIPIARVKNFGTLEQTFNVAFKIGNVYTSNPRKKTLAGGIEDTVNFNSWVPIRGIYVTKCSLGLDGDINHSNDTMSRQLIVDVNDVGVLDILAPTGTYTLGDSVQPKVKIKNLGTTTKQCSTFVSIWEGKNSCLDTLLTELITGKESTLVFKYFKPDVATNPYWIEARISPRDNNPSNDVKEGSFEVVSPPAPPTPGWHLKDPVPTKVLGPPPKYVKDGGAITATGTGLYAFRGNRSNEFYKFIIGPAADTWTLLNAIESIPFAGKVVADTYYITPQKKYPTKGASLCYDGENRVYATKGGSTREFWAYNIVSDNWTKKHPAPTIKGIKGGSSLVFNRDTVYLLAGSVPKPESANFFAYVPSKDSWIVKAKSPTGPYNKTWKDGSCLTTLDGIIYALKGGDNKQGYFYEYVPGTPGSWTQLESIPKIDTMTRPPSRILKKTCTPKDGAAISAIENKVCAEKGGGSWQLWVYDIATNHWTQSVEDTIPRLNNKSYAKTGAGMASVDGKLYLMKGNNTPEFWQYIPSAEMSNVKGRKSKVGQGFSLATNQANLKVCPTISINPNPFTRQTVIQYTIPFSGKVSLKLYNSTGRLVETLIDEYQNTGSYSLKIDNWKLEISKGIYFLKYETSTDTKEIKLIVE